jgi:Tetratricopeptide repeat
LGFFSLGVRVRSAALDQRLTSERARAHQISGGKSGGETPVPIPNTEVKTASADGTWGETPRESRSPPDSSNERPRSTEIECAGAFVVPGGRAERAGTLAAMPRPDDREPRRRRARDRDRRGRRGPRQSTDGGRHRRRRDRGGDVRNEIVRLGGAKGPRYYDQLMKAADAYGRDHERDALRLLRPLRDALPESPSVRELLGLVHYRLGHYQAAAKELEAFVELGGSVEQHPVLMDCYRAQRRWRKVDQCWRELTAASPGADVVTEGRIVAAGALADRGRLDEAIALLTRADRRVAKPKPHHVRLWYALADLEERAGNVPRARALFDRVRREDAGFADVAERLAGLR